jgi:hypothetical protein
MKTSSSGKWHHVIWYVSTNILKYFHLNLTNYMVLHSWVQQAFSYYHKNLKSHMAKKSTDQWAYTFNPQTILEI